MIDWQQQRDWAHAWDTCCEIAHDLAHERGRPPPDWRPRTDAEALQRSRELLLEDGWHLCCCGEPGAESHELHSPWTWCTFNASREARTQAKGAA